MGKRVYKISIARILPFLIVVVALPSVASMTVCKPVNGRVITDRSEYIVVAPGKDGNEELFPALNYTKHITIRSLCRATLADYHVTVRGECSVRASISRERNNSITSPLHSTKYSVRQPTLSIEGLTFSLDQTKAWLEWQSSHEGVDLYHIDVRISSVQGKTCFVKPEDGSSRSILVRLQDIDECQDRTRQDWTRVCTDPQCTCINSIGTYTCDCPGLMTTATKNGLSSTGQHETSPPPPTTTTSLTSSYMKPATTDVVDSASVQPIGSETTQSRDNVSPSKDRTSMATPVTFKKQTSSNTTMTIVIAVAVGVVTALVLTVVLVVILIRRRKQQQVLNITPANDKPEDQSNAPDVVHYRNIGGGVARISSASAEGSVSSAVQADTNAVQTSSGAEQYARVGASLDSHPYVYALPAASGNDQARPCIADNQLAGAGPLSINQAGSEQIEKPVCPVVHPYVYSVPVKSSGTADGQARMGTADDQLAGGRSVSSKQAVTEQIKKPLPYHLTKKNPAATTSVTTVSSSDVRHGGNDRKGQMVREVCPLDYEDVAVDCSPYSLARDITSGTNCLRSTRAVSADGCESGNGTDQVVTYAVPGENTPVPSGTKESPTQVTYTHLVFEPRPLDQAPTTPHGSDIHPPAQSSVIYSAVDRTLSKEVKEGRRLLDDELRGHTTIP